jgi:hypothetical protein
MPLGGSGSKDSAAVARAFRHGIHDAVFEAVAESTNAREGERDLRLKARFLLRRAS